MAFTAISDILKYKEENNCKFWEAIVQQEAKDSLVDEKTVIDKMTKMYHVMKEADASYDGALMSNSGLSGGNGLKMQNYADPNGKSKNRALCGEFGSHVMASAIKMAENNACMKRIVASPTAGSCGVVPAVLLNYEKMENMPEQTMVEALIVAAGIGNVIAERASIAGAAGGCQAEIGTSSSMAAGALAYLRGGDGYIADAAALAMKNMLGLVCDPVGGLVEVPCVKRNAAGAMNALCAADMALAGIKSAIDVDKVYDAMRQIGEMMDKDLKETGKAGLAQVAEQ
mgnify:FL=1